MSCLLNMFMVAGLIPTMIGVQRTIMRAYTITEVVEEDSPLALEAVMEVEVEVEVERGAGVGREATQTIPISHLQCHCTRIYLPSAFKIDTGMWSTCASDHQGTCFLRCRNLWTI